MMSEVVCGSETVIQASRHPTTNRRRPLATSAELLIGRLCETGCRVSQDHRDVWEMLQAERHLLPKLLLCFHHCSIISIKEFIFKKHKVFLI